MNPNPNPNLAKYQPMGSSSSSSPAPQTLDPKIDPPSANPSSPPSDQGSKNPNPTSPETKESPASDVGSLQNPEDPKRVGGGGEQEEEEEEEECGFCLFMKGGGCKDAFVAWEKCVEDAERDKEDIAEKCFEVTSKLKQCMDAHADYYEPILSAEKAMSDSIAEEVEHEKAREASDAAAERVEVITVRESES